MACDPDRLMMLYEMVKDLKKMVGEISPEEGPSAEARRRLRELARDIYEEVKRI
jgi:hypothetical protein